MAVGVGVIVGVSVAVPVGVGVGAGPDKTNSTPDTSLTVCTWDWATHTEVPLTQHIAYQVPSGFWPTMETGMLGPNWATSGKSGPGPERKLTKPVVTKTKGVGVTVGVSVGSGMGVLVGTKNGSEIGAVAAVGVGCGITEIAVGVARSPLSTVTTIGGVPGPLGSTVIAIRGDVCWDGLAVASGRAVAGSNVGGGVGVTVGAGVGGIGITELGSTPGGMTMTPGVPWLGGVTTTNSAIESGVGVNVGATTRVGTGVGVGRTKISPAAQPSVASTSIQSASQGGEKCFC